MNMIKGKYFAIKQAGLRFRDGCIAYPGAKLRGNALPSYWGYGNFGDLITPLLLREIGYTPVHCARVNFSSFVFVGSVLDSIQNSFKGVILGSGFLNDKRPKQLNNATILGVRGKLSKVLVGTSDNVALGDGGLILARFLTDRPSSKYKLGIVPHYMDDSNEIILSWRKRFGSEVKVINVRQSPEKVFYEIASCSHVLSSSLHGLVVADSIGIPNRWMSLSDLSGNKEFKFHDYYSAFDVERVPSSLTGNESISELIDQMLPAPEGVTGITDRIYKLFMSLSEYFPKR